MWWRIEEGEAVNMLMSLLNIVHFGSQYNKTLLDCL